MRSHRMTGPNGKTIYVTATKEACLQTVLERYKRIRDVDRERLLADLFLAWEGSEGSRSSLKPTAHCHKKLDASERNTAVADSAQQERKSLAGNWVGRPPSTHLAVDFPPPGLSAAQASSGPTRLK